MKAAREVYQCRSCQPEKAGRIGACDTGEAGSHEILAPEGDGKKPSRVREANLGSNRHAPKLTRRPSLQRKKGRGRGANPRQP